LVGGGGEVHDGAGGLVVGALVGVLALLLLLLGLDRLDGWLLLLLAGLGAAGNWLL